MIKCVMPKKKANRIRSVLISSVLRDWPMIEKLYFFSAVTKKLVNIKIGQTIKIYWWEDDVINDLKDMKIRNCWVYIQDKKWQNIDEKMKHSAN